MGIHTAFLGATDCWLLAENDSLLRGRKHRDIRSRRERHRLEEAMLVLELLLLLGQLETLLFHHRLEECIFACLLHHPRRRGHRVREEEEGRCALLGGGELLSGSVALDEGSAEVCFTFEEAVGCFESHGLLPFKVQGPRMNLCSSLAKIAIQPSVGLAQLTDLLLVLLLDHPFFVSPREVLGLVLAAAHHWRCGWLAPSRIGKVQQRSSFSHCERKCLPPRQ